MAEKLTLKLGKKIPSTTSRSNGIEVEVIKKRRVFSTTENTSSPASTVQSDFDIKKADKLKNILENAKRLEEVAKEEQELLAKAEQERLALIEKERKLQEELTKKAEEETSQVKEEEVVEQVEDKSSDSDIKKYKKNKDSYSDTEREDDEDDYKSKNKKSSHDNRKINFSNVVVSQSDLDFDDEDEDSENAPSSSLTSAMEAVATYQKRRSFASIKRQKEKQYRKFMERQEPKKTVKTYHEVILPETISGSI